MVFHKYDVPGWQNESYIGVMTWKKQYFPDILNVFVHLWVHKLFPAYFSLTFSQCNYVYFSSFVIPGHLAKMSLFDGKIYFWVNICPYWASRVLDNIQGKYGTNQNCFRTRLAQNSNFIRPGLTFCHPGTMRWPGHIWSARLEIFVNSDKKVLWEREKHWKPGEKWILVTEHWNICVLSPRDIMVAQQVFCKKLFLRKLFWKENFQNLCTWSKTCPRCTMSTQMLHLLSFPSHPSLCPGMTNLLFSKRYRQGSLWNQSHWSKPF